MPTPRARPPSEDPIPLPYATPSPELKEAPIPVDCESPPTLLLKPLPKP